MLEEVVGRSLDMIQTKDGELGRSLLSMCKQRPLSNALLGELNAFVQKLFDFQIVGRDIHAENIIYGARDDAQMFFLWTGLVSVIWCLYERSAAT